MFILLKKFFFFYSLLQGMQFYTQIKTVTQMWREDDATGGKAAVAMPVMR